MCSQVLERLRRCWEFADALARRRQGTTQAILTQLALTCASERFLVFVYSCPIAPNRGPRRPLVDRSRLRAPTALAATCWQPCAYRKQSHHHVSSSDVSERSPVVFAGSACSSAVALGSSPPTAPSAQTTKHIAVRRQRTCSMRTATWPRQPRPHQGWTSCCSRCVKPSLSSCLRHHFASVFLLAPSFWFFILLLCGIITGAVGHGDGELHRARCTRRERSRHEAALI